MNSNKSETFESPQIVIPSLALSKKQMLLTDKEAPNTTRAQNAGMLQLQD